MNPINSYRAFLDFKRVEPGYRPVEERVRDWREVEQHLSPAELTRQAGQMDQRRDDPGADEPERAEHLVLLDVLGEVAAGHALVHVLMPGQRVELFDARLHVVPGDPLAGLDRG